MDHLRQTRRDARAANRKGLRHARPRQAPPLLLRPFRDVRQEPQLSHPRRRQCKRVPPTICSLPESAANPKNTRAPTAMKKAKKKKATAKKEPVKNSPPPPSQEIDEQ